MKEIKAAGGVIFKQTESLPDVLLIYRNRVWDLPKGKLEKGESIEECAIREVEEEIGCEAPKSLGLLTQSYHEYKQRGKKYGKTTYWYAMTTPTIDNFSPEHKEGIEKVAWFTLEKALQKVGYENLKEVLQSLKSWHKKRHG